jgi:hypothetical protein
MPYNLKEDDPDYDPIDKLTSDFFDFGQQAEKESRASERLQLERQKEARLAQRDASREQERISRSVRPATTQRVQPSPRLSAPNFVPPGAGSIGGGVERSTAMRVIVVITIIAAVGVVARDAAASKPGKTYTNIGGHNVAVPNHLRSLAGVFLAGTVALLVAEVQPGVGLLLGVGLGFIVLRDLTSKGGILNRLGGALLGGASGALQSGVTPTSGALSLAGPNNAGPVQVGPRGQVYEVLPGGRSVYVGGVSYTSPAPSRAQ